MQSLNKLSNSVLQRVRGVLTDIDGTLTTDGRLPASTYLALDGLRQVGLHVIPVTGRCIAWAEILTRLWPVDAIIGAAELRPRIIEAIERALTGATPARP